jgi:glycosyltransferase involved in cell wall biosynthesis
VSDLPRLLLCCFDVVPAPTAISRRMTEYLKGLSDRYQVVVLSVKTPDHTHIERYHGARLLRVPVGSGDLAARVQAFDRAVRRQLESEEYVMVHFFDPFGGYALCERRSELGYKLVYDACSLPSVDLPFLVDEAEANRRFIARVRRQELFCLMNADVVIVANELTREFVTSLGVSREQVQLLPSPVDLVPFEPRVMGLPDATPMKLLHLGNLSSAQDLGTLLEAMQIALQTVDVRLTVVGPPHPEHQARLEEQVAALKLTGKVDFQPPVPHDDLHKVLATSDVGLLTLSDVERNSRVGSPLSRLGEYLAAGRPVIAADVAAARAVLPDDGVVLYRPQDKHSLADAICTLASEPERRIKLGAAARAASLARDGLKIRADLVATYVAVSGTGVRAVGDADQTSPDEVTQLGRSLEGEDTQRRKATAESDAPSGTNKVKTDPAISAADTSPEAALADRPAVMGVPLREEEPPVVLGQEAQEMAAELVQVSTQPNASRPTEPPVVMGTPLAQPGPNSNLTPGDLAAELDDIASGSATSAAPTGEDDGPRHLEDDLPDTGGHLSLVPRTPTPLESPITAPTAAPPTLEATPSPAAPPLDEPTPVAEPLLADEPLSFLPPPAPAQTVPPPKDILPPFVPVLPPEAPPIVQALPEPAKSVPAAPLPIFVPPAAITAPSPPPAVSPPSPAAPQAAAAPVFIPPLEMPRSSPSAAASAPPPLPRGARTSSIIAPPPVKSSPSTPGFVAFLTPPRAPEPGKVPPPLPRTASGVFPLGPSVPPRTNSGVFPVVPAIPPRTNSGMFPIVPASAMTEPRQGSGLFPEPPRVPSPTTVEEAESISEDEIEAVGDEGPEEVGADEVMEVASAPAHIPPFADEAPVMAAEEMVTTVDTDASPPPSAIDPWLAQLVHGYCPPESGLFERHTPPTTMPGRDT